MKRLWPKIVLLGIAPFIASAATNGALPASQFCTVGDSIAVGLKNIGIPGIAVGAKNTQVVLGYAQQLAGQQTTCKTVILSSGTSNELFKIGGATVNMDNVKKNVPAQIRALKAAGKKVILLGVGSQFNSDINDLLKKIAAEEGVTFSMLGNTPDRVHPVASQLFSTISNGGVIDTSPVSTANTAAPPVSAPPLTQTQSPSLLSQLMAPPTTVPTTPQNSMQPSSLSSLFSAFNQPSPTSAAAPASSVYVPTIPPTPVPVSTDYAAMPTPVSQTLANLSSAPNVTQSPLVLFTPSTALSNTNTITTPAPSSTSQTAAQTSNVTITPIVPSPQTSFGGSEISPDLNQVSPFAGIIVEMRQFVASLLSFLHR